MDIRQEVQGRSAKHHVFYKVWAHPFAFPQYTSSAEISDWSAFYFQHTIRHALRYLTKKFDDGHNQVDLIRITVENPSLEIIRLVDPYFGQSTISGQQKAQKAKHILKINGKLMQQLGKKHSLLELLDCDQFEVIFPHLLFNQKNIKHSIVGTFECHPTERYLTHRYRTDGNWIICKGDARYEPYLLSDDISS